MSKLKVHVNGYSYEVNNVDVLLLATQQDIANGKRIARGLGIDKSTDTFGVQLENTMPPGWRGKENLMEMVCTVSFSSSISLRICSGSGLRGFST